jgi:hypothetical protein
MTTCSYCNQPATMSIISMPAQVCAEHAREFWTGLLAYAHSRSGPCVKLERMCDCPLCEELSAEPADYEDFKIEIAS